jgi:hypothetical protein
MGYTLTNVELHLKIVIRLVQMWPGGRKVQHYEDIPDQFLAF